VGRNAGVHRLRGGRRMDLVPARHPVLRLSPRPAPRARAARRHRRRRAPHHHAHRRAGSCRQGRADERRAAPRLARGRLRALLGRVPSPSAGGRALAAADTRRSRRRRNLGAPAAGR
jgi:hypothetical protein